MLGNETEAAPKHDRSFEKERFRSVPIDSFFAGGNNALVYSRLSRTARVIDASLVPILQACGKFATLDEHAHNLISKGALPVHTELRYLVEIGALISERTMVQINSKQEEMFAGSDIACLAIPTRERPDQLARALHSYAAHMLRFGRHMRILVSDDARTMLDCEATRAASVRAATATGCKIEYNGYGDKLRFLQLLCDGTDIPERVLRFALFGDGYDGPTMGANRNHILLKTVGDLVLSVDDDTVCKVGTATNSSAQGLVIRGAGSPELWSYADRRSCLDAIHVSTTDIFAEHERLLGRSIATAIEAASTVATHAIDASRACDHLLRDMVRGVGHICVTLNGFAGDSAMYSAMGILTHDGSGTRGRLLASEGCLRQALSSRYVILQVPATSIVHDGHFCSMIMGIDNRQLVPPFFPVFRNEDGVFGSCIGECIPGGYVSHVPFTLIHDPDGPRQYSLDRWATVRVSDAVQTCLSLCSPAHGAIDRVSRQQDLARRLMALASRPYHSFVAELRHGLWLRAAAILRRHSELLATCGRKPEFWAHELEHESWRLRTAVLREDYIVPVELVARRSQVEALTILQRLLFQFGELLWWWPQIVEKAKSLRLGETV